LGIRVQIAVFGSAHFAQAVVKTPKPISQMNPTSHVRSDLIVNDGKEITILNLPSGAKLPRSISKQLIVRDSIFRE